MTYSGQISAHNPPSRPGTSLSGRVLMEAGQPGLELVEGGSDSRDGAPLLFIHGAHAGAWCWSEVFLEFLARRGRHVAAVSLRGHGGSEGGAALREAGVEDLLADVRRAVDAMPRPPVVIGHSFGGYLAQLLIGRVPLRGLVLPGSLPPDGLALVGPSLVVADPKMWSEALISALTGSRTVAEYSQFEFLFADGVPPDRLRSYASRMVPESVRALAEAHLPRPVVSAAFVGLPTLVVNGFGDRLVWPATAWRTALYHGAEPRFVLGGHFLMLEPGAEDVARLILDWLETRGL